MPIRPLDDYTRFPRMVRWFNPWLLFRLLQNVVLSSLFGTYADRRLILAALDNVQPKTLLARAQELKEVFKEEDGAIWLDFVADLGDGFDATYAVASLLAEQQLTFGIETLKKGQVLVMGGDEVYPLASAQSYRNQLRQPYAWASPDPDRRSDHGTPVLAIPGNHDWYDGLDLFLALFCRKRSWHIGSWRTRQRRSYFAIQITEGWWLWATDIQLADNMDQPQADYFSTIASLMPRDAKIILCTAEPGWLYTHTNRRSWGINGYAIWLAESAGRGLTVPVLLSGDTHHYSRYSASDGKQFITSGGGGAFLHPTHQLDDKVEVDWLGSKKALSLTTSPAGDHLETSVAACFPSKSESKGLVWGNLWFALSNWDFSLFLGVVYWVAGLVLLLRPYPDAKIILGLLFGWTLIGYTANQEKSYRPRVLISSALHALAHMAVVLVSAEYWQSWNDEHVAFGSEWYSIWKWLFLLLLEMGAVGFAIGSTIFGLNLLVTCRWLRMNTNDAFSALRSGRYKNFLRLRICGDHLDIFAIGLKDIPRRDDWVDNPAYPGDPRLPVFVAKGGLRPHLIEKIELGTRSATPTPDAKPVERVK